MMTKDQEREVLKKIKALIDSTGSDSYIEAAFAGCCEIAADNIENDFMTSLKDRAEEANKREAAAKLEAQELKDNNKRLQTTVECQEEIIKQLEGKHEGLVNRLNEREAEKRQALEEAIAKQKEVDQLKAEIINLKAKLYDLMTQ